MAQTPRKPQDHKTKGGDADDGGHPDQPFTFTHDGDEHELLPPDTIKTGFWRANRDLNDTDAIFSIIEQLAPEGEEGEAALAAIDDMTRLQFRDLQRRLFAHMGITVGESGAS